MVQDNLYMGLSNCTSPFFSDFFAIECISIFSEKGINGIILRGKWVIFCDQGWFMQY